MGDGLALLPCIPEMMRAMSDIPTDLPEPAPPAQRCAVYTRVSMDNAEDDKLSSVQAQFMACHEFIASQLAQGWVAIDRLYEDRGYAGSHTRRPALQDLLQDVADGLVDMVVVHRLDRLSRHMGDFTGLMQTFERHGVALVSVTQSIDTSGPQGRLTLNLLTSFAQFEREMTGERGQEKRAASRRQGVWQGGAPPLGYGLAQQRLVEEPAEAQTVRYIFERFLQQPSVTALIQELTAQGVKTKAWHTKAGLLRGGRTFDKNVLYKLLNNRMYLGELFYEDAWHPSIHQPLIEQVLWDEVHELMASRARRTGVLNRDLPAWQFPLKGLVFGEDGRSMTPWLSSKQRGRHFSYYIPQKEISVGAGASGLPRLSAYHLHAQVLEHLYQNFRDPSQWLTALPHSLTDHPTFDQALITERLREAARASDLLSLLSKAKLIRLLVEKVVVGPNDILVRIRTKGVFELICDLMHAHETDWVSPLPDPQDPTPHQ
jgi:DNA invertase Pin-like site-specific DNA recombinase